MELLKMYGDVKYFRLMMDRLTGNSRVRPLARLCDTGHTEAKHAVVNLQSLISDDLPAVVRKNLVHTHIPSCGAVAPCPFACSTNSRVVTKPSQLRESKARSARGMCAALKNLFTATETSHGAAAAVSVLLQGFAFAEYTTDQATVAALAALDGAQLGPRRIAANRMLEHKRKEMLKNPQGMQQQQGMWGQQMPGGGVSGGWGRQAGSGGAGMGPAQHSMGGMGMQAGGMGAPGGGMMGGGAMAPAAQAGQGGMQQQGMYGAGAGANMAAGGMPGVDAGQGQQGMYGAAAGGAAGGYGGYGGQMQQGAGMYGSQVPAQQQSGMGMMGAGQGAAAGGMGMGGYGAQMGAAGAAGGMGMGAGYGQMDQQGGYGAQMGAAGYAGGSQPAPPPPFMPAASGAGAGAAGEARSHGRRKLHVPSVAGFGMNHPEQGLCVHARPVQAKHTLLV
jgi:hypothetical protein